MAIQSTAMNLQTDSVNVGAPVLIHYQSGEPQSKILRLSMVITDKWGTSGKYKYGINSDS